MHLVSVLEVRRLVTHVGDLLLGQAGGLTRVDLGLLALVGKVEETSERECREEGDCVHADVDVVGAVVVRSLLLGEDVGRDGTGKTTEADNDGNADRSLGLTTDGLSERSNDTGESSVGTSSRDELGTVGDLGVGLGKVEREAPADTGDEGAEADEGESDSETVREVSEDDRAAAATVYTGTV